MPETNSSASARSGSASDRALGTIVVGLFLLAVLAIAWYGGLADGGLVRYLGAAAAGVVLFVLMVMTARDAKPRRLALVLAVVLALLLLSRCGGAPGVRQAGPEPTPPWAGDPLPPAPPVKPPAPPAPPAPVAAPAPAPVPVPAPAPIPPPPPVVAKERPADPPPAPPREVDLTQFRWERFVWDQRTGGSWGWRRVADGVTRTWSIDTATNAANLVRLKRERAQRPGSWLEWSGNWGDGSSGTRLVLPTVAPGPEDFRRVEELAGKDPEAQFVWEPQADGQWAWRRLEQREQPPGGVRDSSTDAGDYRRLAAEHARIPGSSLEWSGSWHDGMSGWRLLLPADAEVTPAAIVPRGQTLRGADAGR
jgi:hypothetical protein